MTSHQLRIAIVEDEDLFRDLLRLALERHERFHVVGSFSNAPEALERIPNLEPDLVMLDIVIVGGRVLASLSFTQRSSNFSEASRRTAHSFAKQAALTLENAQLNAQLREQLTRLRQHPASRQSEPCEIEFFSG